jgi:hypothetical protein
VSTSTNHIPTVSSGGGHAGVGGAVIYLDCSQSSALINRAEKNSALHRCAHLLPMILVVEGLGHRPSAKVPASQMAGAEQGTGAEESHTGRIQAVGIWIGPVKFSQFYV